MGRPGGVRVDGSDSGRERPYMSGLSGKAGERGWKEIALEGMIAGCSSGYHGFDWRFWSCI